ncbi:MAG TPA: alpha/beta fold hydrolase [Bryobacteraceae bacterium]|nr:alpha/beta fold hydrolase [Bryobacteraceae bacterium]
MHRPERPNGDAFALTHGAGSNLRAPLLVHMAEALEEAGYVVLRYDLPFRVQRPKGPPFPAQAVRDREGVVKAIEALRQETKGRVFAGGHSYGGRQSAMAAAERAGMAGALLLFSYPLHPPGKPAQKRTAFFGDLRIPVLFVHGTSDPFGSLEELREAMALIPAPTDLLPVEGAGHDLKRAAGLSADVLARLHALVG